MATTITKIGTPTNVTGTTISGGTLDASTTYYFVVVGWNMSYTTSGTAGRYAAFGDISEEGTFTTDETNKSVLITWTDHTGCTNYNVSLTTVSGQYNTSGCGGYGTVGRETLGNFTDGSVGVTITARSIDIYPIHSVNLTNEMSPFIDNTKGMIMVELDGTEIESLQTIYNDIVTAGYSGYAYYDGYSFVMKGWITANTTDTGSLVVENKRIIMLKGGIANMSAEGGYVYRFGRWLNDDVGGSPIYGCIVDCQGARYNFYGIQNGSLLFYDSYLSFAKSRDARNSENFSIGYFNAGSGSFAYSNLSGYNGAILNATGRGTNSTIQDIKYGAGNNWPNNNMIRLKIWSSPNMPYSAGLGAFYDCDWNYRIFQIYTFVGKPLNYTNMYNCRFTASTGDVGMIVNPDVRFYVTNEITTDNYIMNHYSLDMQVLDEDGLPLSGVTVSGTDFSGNTVTWIEAGSSPDYLVTGTEYTTDRTTDSDGKVFYYVKGYQNYLNPNNTENIGGYSLDSFKFDYYPYTFNFSKDGYVDYSILIEELIQPTIGIITLPTAVLSKVTTKGNMVLLSNPELGANSQFFEI